MSILVTGGAGYIGSHTVIDLVENGMDPVIADNLCNSKFEAVRRVRELCGREVKFYEYDLCDIDKVRDIFSKEDIDAVIHFAGLKAVGESCEKPLEYFRNNLGNTLNLLQVMREHGVKNFVFSSSATVYGQPKTVPIKEDFPLSVTNPYGRTKLMIEDILRDVYKARLAPLLQPHRRAQERQDRGGSQRHPQQPHALHLPSGDRQAGKTARIRQRLPHSRRHGRA